MSMEIKVGDIGIFSGRVDKKAKVLRVDDTYVSYLVIDENKKKYIYLADFKKKFKKEGEGEIKEQNKEIKTKEISENKKIEKPSKPSYTIVGVYLNKEDKSYEETENLNQKGLLGYRIRYNKEPKMFFGQVNWSLDELDEAKKRLEYSNEKAEKDKEFKKIRDAENKIKREENKIIEKQKLEAANKELISKPSFLMTLSEYQEKVIPILLQYQKFLRRNSQYLQPADYEGIYQYTYPELEADFDNKTIKGRRFAISTYKENPLKDFKASHYPEDEIVEMNKSFVNKLKNFFTDDEIYTLMSKDEYKSNKRAVKRAIDNDTYKKLLESGELTESELQTIAKSVDVSIPKKVFSVENVKAKEMQEKFAKLLANLPTINKEQLNKLIESIKIDFKPLEEEVFFEEKFKYTQKFKKLLEKEKVYVSSLDMTIKIWENLFSYEKLGYDKIKTGTFKTNYYTKQQEEIIDERQYATGLKLKSDWESTFDKFLKDYIDTLKYSFINAIINNFDRITKPITEIVKLRIELGDRGFEGEYRFKFDDGSYFDFKAEAIRAGGYNIQILHLRYITNFLNITLADGTKVTGYSNLIENFNTTRMEKGGLTHDDMKNKTDKYKDILKKPSNLLKISHMHKLPVEFLQSQLVKGMKVESEHTKREAVAKIIALHHLEEDPRYYIKLEKVEGDKMADGGLIYKKIYNRAGGGYTTIINGMLYNINKQYERGTWVAQSDDGEYYKETQTLAELKDYLKHLNKKNKIYDGGDTKSIFYKGYKIDDDGMYKKMNKMSDGGVAYDEQEWKKTEEQYELQRLGEVTYRAKRDIVDADDTDEAIQKFYDARNEYRAFEQAIKDREDNKRRDINIKNLIEDEIEDEKKQGDKYEYKDLFKKSPALAALQSLKDMREWVQSEDSKDYDRKAGYSEEKIEESVNRMSNYYSQSIKDLEYHIGLKKSKSKKLAEGGELNPDDKAVKSAMTHKAGSAGGLLVGNRHSEGGIKAVNKSTNSPIEMEGGEVVITRNAVSDNSKREFEGKMMTNRQILSRINESGGGVSFASGGDVPSSCKCSGKSYKYGGKSVSDYDIIKSMNSNIED